MSVLDLVLTNGSKVDSSDGPIRVLGLDLGTTNSTVAEIIYNPASPHNTSVQCLPIEQPTFGRSHWNPLVPSVVALSDGREWIGEGARHFLQDRRHSEAIPLGNIFFNCKNDIGLQRTYVAAPSGYRNAAEISSRILAFLYQGALKQKAQIPEKVTVTVPASFQISQRDDTAKAAQIAQLPTTNSDFLDEPIAAFIGYLADHSAEQILSPGAIKNLMVFDFGGGTCDVALFRISMDLVPPLRVESLSVSRYHRLGGSDIDQAIFYEILLPQILEQSDMNSQDLDFDTKKNHLEPAFIRVAEQLKMNYCEIKNTLTKTEGDDESIITATVKGDFEHKLPDGRCLIVSDPLMNHASYEKALAPFISYNFLYAKESEYRQTLSIFAPINDALERSSFDPEDIDLCLMVGGSCLIPEIKEAMREFFPESNLLTFDNPDNMQTVIARGAAINALSLALNKKPIIQPICQEVVAIKTQTGIHDLIPKGVALPWPSNGRFQRVATLAVPESSEREPVNLKIEVISYDGKLIQPLVSGIWEIPAPVQSGEKLQLECRFDANQVLKMRMSHLDRSDVPPFKGRKENPFTHVINPQTVRLRVDETEERLRTGKVNPDDWSETMVKLADDCAELKQYEKAINKIGDIMRRNNQPSSYLLNKMAIFTGYLGDKERQEEIYKAAIEEDPTWSTAWFNLALLQQKQNRLTEAKDSLSHAIASDREEAPYYVLQADIARQEGKDFAVSEFLDLADKCQLSLNQQSSWEISWSLTAARLSGDEDKIKEIAEYKKRTRIEEDVSGLSQNGCLPAFIEESVV